MADIFLNYIRKNRNIFNRVSAQPEATEWSAWWDREIGAGQSWREAFDRSLATMRTIGTRWSKQAIDREEVKEEIEPGGSSRAIQAVRPLLIGAPTLARLADEKSVKITPTWSLNDTRNSAVETKPATTFDAIKFPPSPVLSNISIDYRRGEVLPARISENRCRVASGKRKERRIRHETQGLHFAPS